MKNAADPGAVIERPPRIAAPRRWRRRDVALAAAGMVGALLAASVPRRLAAQPAAPAEPSPEAAGEVYALILASQRTQIAIRESGNRKVQELREQIAAQQRRVVQLQADVKAGLARADELAIEAAKVAPLQRQLALALAELDREYALSMYELRAGLVRISSEPAGLAALARFRAGEHAQALADLDGQAELRWRARQERRAAEDAMAVVDPDPTLAAELKARVERRRRAEDAQDRRDIALLAWEAIGRPGVPSEDVLARLRSVVRLDPTAAMDSVLLARLHRQRGSLSDMEQAAEIALRYALPEREKALALSEIGFSWRLLGRLAPARRALQEALDLRQKQARSAPGALDLKRYLSVAQERMGELELDEGRFDKALEQFRSAEELRRGLAGTMGSVLPSLSARRDLALALGQSGRALLEMGDVARAREVLREALREIGDASDLDPGAPEARRDRAVLLAREGDGALLDGQLAQAAKAYEDSLALREQLVAADSSSVRAKRDVTAVMQKIADLHLRQEGPSAKVQEEFRRVQQRLPGAAAGDAPLAGDLRRDRLIVEGKLAWLKVLAGDPGPVTSALKRVAEEWESIDRQQTGQPTVWRDHALALTRWGSALMDQRKWREAAAPLERALEHRRALLQRDPRARSTRAGEVHVVSLLATLYEETRETARAAKLSQHAKQVFSDLMRETNDTLDGVPDGPGLVLAMATMADTMSDRAYAEKVAPAVKTMRQQIKVVPRDEQKLQGVRVRNFQS